MDNENVAFSKSARYYSTKQNYASTLIRIISCDSMIVFGVFASGFLATTGLIISLRVTGLLTPVYGKIQDRGRDRRG